MSFLYFAYGSNLWPPQLRWRCPGAEVIGTGTAGGWRLVFDKPSTDGSAKANIRPDPVASVPGVVYRIDDGERRSLDAAEPGYGVVEVVVDGTRCLSYAYDGPAHQDDRPYDWYLETMRVGRAAHRIDAGDLMVEARPDPLCPGVVPAGPEILPEMQEVLTAGLLQPDRYTIHPGDLAWWIHHADPRLAPTDSYWMMGDDAVLVIDAKNLEICVFTRPGVDRAPLLAWAQRRLSGRGKAALVSADDAEMVDHLRARGYTPGHTYVTFAWDLTGTPIPTPRIPAGWRLRPLAGESEANLRREASHRAFESRMSDEAHLERYLRFMRSPVYQPERDLVAVAPDGRIAAFTVWWPDRTGVAQIEPFGTHPDFQGQGIGRALIYFALERMRAEGMATTRVMTDEDRPAVSFYRSVGFGVVGSVSNWDPPAH